MLKKSNNINNNSIQKRHFLTGVFFVTKNQENGGETMAKKIAIARVEPIILEFEDGTQKTLLLNNSALIILNKEFGDIAEIFKFADKKPMEVMTKLVYAGIKANEPDFTYEEAEIIAVNGGFALLMELTQHLSEVLDGYCKEEDIKKKLISKVHQQIESLSR